MTNISQQPCDVVTHVATILQMGKLRLREVQLHAQGQETTKWRNLGLNPGLLTLKLNIFSSHCVLFT